LRPKFSTQDPVFCSLLAWPHPRRLLRWMSAFSIERQLMPDNPGAFQSRNYEYGALNVFEPDSTAICWSLVCIGLERERNSITVKATELI